MKPHGGHRPAPHQQGPQIIVRSPQEGVQITCPFDLDVQFASCNGVAVDVKSLRVHVRKVWKFDITERVRPYASPEGIRIPNATFPQGRHTVTLTIADHEGRGSSRTITVEIV